MSSATSRAAGRLFSLSPRQDQIVTSGLGGYYPSGLVIGSVESLQTGDDGLARYAVLTPMMDFNALTEVFVITDYDIVD